MKGSLVLKYLLFLLLIIFTEVLHQMVFGTVGISWFSFYYHVPIVIIFSFFHPSPFTPLYLLIVEYFVSVACLREFGPSVLTTGIVSTVIYNLKNYMQVRNPVSMTIIFGSFYLIWIVLFHLFKGLKVGSFGSSALEIPSFIIGGVIFATISHFVTNLILKYFRIEQEYHAGSF